MARKIADTKKLTHDEWVALRKSSLGGSDAGTVMGMNPYSSLITLYADKTGLSSELADNEAMRLGRDLEQYVAERYMEESGKKVRQDHYMYAHDEYGFLTANIDRRIVGENAGLECKTMSSFNGCNFEGGDVPPHYYCQCQHYMMVMDFDYMDLAVLVLQKGIYIVHIDRNDDFISKMIAAEKDFWENFVIPQKIPAPDGSEASLQTLKELYPQGKPDTEIEIVGLDQMITDYKMVSAMVSEYEEKKKAIQGKICALLGDYEIGIGDAYACSWKSQSRSSLDSKRLKDEMPDVYAEYSKVTNYRTFRTKKYNAKKK